MYYMLMFYMIIMIMFLMFFFIYLFSNHISIYLEFELINIMSLKMQFLLYFDWISILFSMVVLMISLMVILYSLEYMEYNLNLNRFIYMIYMFIISMLMLIYSPNLLSILFGWDGLGLISYCLVIFYQSKNSYNSGMVTVLTNRLGDIMIMMSLGLMVSKGSWNYMFMNNLNNLIWMLLIISSMTKSAQIPFSSWLPMAMAAPTPISSLVHSSTLVTAGVYLMMRLNYLLYNEFLINMMMLVSVMTMFMSGLGANFEFDLKKIIALSTLSQLGVMFFCMSLKMMEISFFHLLTHAMFKSLLFMCAGVIIHNMMGNQDIRYISMVLYNLPLVSLMFNCSSMSLCGIPFLSGFFSKDLIIEMFLMSYLNKFIMILLFLSMGLTVSYTIRLIFYSFIKVPQLNLFFMYKMIKSKMGISMYLLFMFSIFMGLILSWLMFSMKNYIYLTKSFKLMIYVFMMIGVLISVMFMNFYMNIFMYKYCNLYMKMFMMLWFLNILYSIWIPSLLKFSNYLIYYLEIGWLEYFMGNGFMKLMKLMFKIDFLKNYMFLLVFFFLMLILILIY